MGASLRPPLSITETHARRKAEWSGWRKSPGPGVYAQDERLARQRHIRRLYGMELSDWDALYSEQGGCCSICRRPFGDMRVNVDHVMRGVLVVVRGLLCSRCNTGLGMLGDGEDGILARAMEYVSEAA